MSCSHYFLLSRTSATQLRLLCLILFRLPISQDRKTHFKTHRKSHKKTSVKIINLKLICCQGNILEEGESENNENDDRRIG